MEVGTRCPYLVKLVHCRTYRPYQVFLHAGSLEHAVQDLPVVDLDCIGLPAESVKNVGGNLEDFGIGDHSVVGACDVDVALIELAHAALGHGGLVAAVHLCDLVALEALHARVHGKPSGERDCQVVAQRAQLPALILQVVDQLGVFSIFAAQDVLELEDGSIERRGPVALENLGDGLEETVAEGSILAGPCCC